MARHKDGKPLGRWQLEKKGEYFTDYRWECPFCGKVERYGFSNKSDGRFEDSLYDKDHCWHCNKDADGNVELHMYRDGDNGYWGDGDFSWHGSWSGVKKILVHRPFDFDRYGWYGEERIPYDRPDVILKVSAWSRGWNSKTGQHHKKIYKYSARLTLVHWGHSSIELVTGKRVNSMKQLKEEISRLDVSHAIPGLLKEYYDRTRTRAVWRREGDEWVPYMTTYSEVEGFSLEYGLYAVWDPFYKRYHRLERSSHVVSGGGFKPEDEIKPPPPPWTEDAAPMSSDAPYSAPQASL